MAKDSVPLVIPLSKEGNESTISTESELLQTARIRVPRDLQEFGIPSHVGGLVFKPAHARDDEEAQMIFLDKCLVFKGFFMDTGNQLHFVLLRCEEEGSQIVKVIDDGFWHRVDSSKDVVPCLRRFLDFGIW